MRVVVKYSEAFKLKVVREIESGKFLSRQEARQRYGIKGSHTVAGWVRKYGSARIQGRVVRVETTEERDQIKALKARIAELEGAIVDSKVEESLSKAYFDIVCRECGVKDPQALKKSIAEKLSRERTAVQKAR